MPVIDDETLPDPRLPPPPSGKSPGVDLGDRYDLGAMIGRGGEVRIARDTRIGFVVPFLGVFGLSVSRNTDRIEASTLVHAQRWHLKQLLPSATDVETGRVPKLTEADQPTLCSISGGLAKNRLRLGSLKRA